MSLSSLWLCFSMLRLVLFYTNLLRPYHSMSIRWSSEHWSSSCHCNNLIILCCRYAVVFRDPCTVNDRSLGQTYTTGHIWRCNTLLYIAVQMTAKYYCCTPSLYYRPSSAMLESWYEVFVMIRGRFFQICIMGKHTMFNDIVPEVLWIIQIQNC